MDDLELAWALSAPALLGIAAAAIAVLLFLIIKLKVHAFLSLTIVSILTAIAAGVPFGSLIDVLYSGFGSTLASVALLVGLGAMLGRMLEFSGGAQVMTDALIRWFGERRAPLALSVASLLLGFPIFFDAGLVVMLPIIFTVARRLGGSLLLYAFPAATAFSVMHIFVPPHPGPVAASGLLGADVGLVLLLGLLVAIPSWYLVGAVFGRFIGRRIHLDIPDVLFGERNDADGEAFASRPRLGVIFLLLLLPVLLIGMNTVLNSLATAGVVSLDDAWVQVVRAFGETPIALLVSVLLAMVLLGLAQRKSGALIERIVDGALGPICSIVLITGAGGMFGGVLRASGIGDALAGSLDAVGLPVFVAGFIIAAIVRVAQGSATVALTTAAALIQPVVLDGGFNAVQVAALVLVLAAGSVIASHVNDSGFWLVSRFFGMDTVTTLKTWTVGQTLMAVCGFAFAGAIYLAGTALG